MVYRCSGTWFHLDGFDLVVAAVDVAVPDVVDGVGRVGSIPDRLFEFEKFHYAGVHGSTSRSDLHGADP